MSKQKLVDSQPHVKSSSKDSAETTQKPPVEKGRPLDHDTLSTLQQSVGNQAVQTMLIQQKASRGGGSTPVQDELADDIRAQRGGGQKVDRKVADKTSQVIGKDVSNAKIHTGEKAEQLTSELNARAFTTGNDIFFNKGEYKPDSAEGQKLISHELTHTAQQSGGSQLGKPSGVQGKMSVNDPNDKFEAEADQVAAKVTESASPASGAVQRAPEDEEQVQMKGAEDEELQMQEQEEDELQMKGAEEEEPLQMQAEDEELQMKGAEEDELQMKSAEDEELQAKRQR